MSAPSPCRATSRRTADEIARRTLERFGRIDILINNAALPLSTRFPDLTAEEWRRVIEVNLTAPFLMTKVVLPAMRARHEGRIINISPSAGRMVSTLGGAHYTASKAGLLGLTRVAAKELGKFGITVNAICPGMIDTELTREHASDELPEGLAEPRHCARSREFDLLRRLRGGRLHHRRVPRHQRRRLDDVICVRQRPTVSSCRIARPIASIHRPTPGRHRLECHGQFA